MWPIEAQSVAGRALAWVYRWAVVSCLLLCTAGLLSKACLTSDLVDRSEAIDIFTLTGTGALKLLYFSYHHKTMRALVDMADYNFPSQPLFGKEDFHIHSPLLETLWGGPDQSRPVLHLACRSIKMTEERWMRLCGLLSVAHCATAFFCISFWGVCPLLNVLFGVTAPGEMPLPMNVRYPWDTSASSPYFVPLYLLHYFGLISSTHVYMSTDGFFFSLIFFIFGQIRILKLSLRGLNDALPNNGKESLLQAKENGLKRCIELHNKIKSFLKELDLIFRTMIVADILHAIVSLSFAMFQMSESKGVLENMKMVLFVSYCFIHQYLNSLFGQVLINQQDSLMTEIYSVDWTGESKSFKKSVHIMMTGTVTPIRFSAWRMYYLQYETFVEFCRMMVSVFMVLRTLKYDK